MDVPVIAPRQMDLPGESAEKTFAPATIAGSPVPPLLYELIEAQPFFKGLNREQLQLLAESAMVINFGAGDTILQEGSPANRFYLILEGQVTFEMGLDSHGEKLAVQVLGPGEDLGWSWLFPPYVLHFGARALMPTRTIFFYGTRLREQCEADHEFGFQLMKRVAGVATKCLQDMQRRVVTKISGVE